MRQNIPLVVIVLSGLLAGGCGSLGWYRAIGDFPGVAPSDYAFYNFCGTSSQVFQFSMPQVQSAAIEALRDLGFKDFGPVKPCPGEALAMKMHTPDGRPATITFTPQNSMTNMRIVIGPVHIGDQMLSRDVFRRVALNFGTIPRDYMPLEPILARRINPPTPLPPPTHVELPVTLEGEALRPGESRTAPSPEFTSPVTGTGSGVIPPPADPYRSNFPYNLYPSPYYTPFLPYPYGPPTPNDMMNPYY
ncbi:MAG TPA: hypothetical protein VN648_12300 [Candidatus Methylomirabilis sp.]|nr:hypothetical protein [Candidatus Methylomirabilis sp.]